LDEFGTRHCCRHQRGAVVELLAYPPEEPITIPPGGHVCPVVEQQTHLNIH
jgi:hypothetical protein